MKQIQEEIRIKLGVEAQAKTQGLEQAIKQIESQMKNAGSGAGFKQMREQVEGITQSFTRYKNIISQGMVNSADLKEANKLFDDIANRIDRMGQVAAGLEINVDKLLPKDFSSRVNALNAELTEMRDLMKGGDSSAIQAATQAYEQQKKVAGETADKVRELETLKESQSKTKSSTQGVYTRTLNETKALIGANKELNQVLNNSSKSEVKKKITEVGKAYDEASAKAKSYQKALTSLETAKANLEISDNKTNRQALNNAEAQVKKAKIEGGDVASKEAAALQKQKEALEQILKLKEKEEKYKNAQGSYNKTIAELEKLKGVSEAADAKLTELSDELETLKMKGADTATIQRLREEFANLAGVNIDQVPQDLDEIQAKLETLRADKAAAASQSMKDFAAKLEEARAAAEKAEADLKSFNDEMQRLTDTQTQIRNLTTSMLNFFSLTNGWQLLKRGVKEAYNSIKDLDDAMTEIAVVSDYTIDDLWNIRQKYTQTARQVGMTTLDVVKAQTLYIQQGLDFDEATEASVETLKMAKIAGLESAEATELMTAALRGYNMDMSEANRVNDVYSALAAKTAANTEQIATAMSKTSSIAYNAGASFENMSAFLSQIIETTQEAPETAGTAMKTIIARFQELKKSPLEIGEVDGEVVNANAIEAALAEANVALRGANGEFRNFDEVILELSGKWDTLDVMTQRYIATMAAGSRQQSRFIALMSDNERLTELTGIAADSAGAAQIQYEKTLDSLTTKITLLKDAWQSYLRTLADSTILKGAIDLLTKLIQTINDLTGSLPPILGSLATIMLSYGAFKAAGAIVTKAMTGIGRQMYKSGLQAGAQGAAGIEQGLNSNLNRGLTNVANTWKKFTNLFKKTTWVGQTNVIKYDDKALKKYVVAQKIANDQTLQGTQSQMKANAVLAAQGTMLNMTADEQQALNTMKMFGVGADLAAKSAVGGLTNEMVENIVTQGIAQGLTKEEIKARLENAAAIYEEIGADTVRQSTQKAGILTRAKDLLALLFTTKGLEKNTDGTYKNTIAQSLSIAAKNGSAVAQWALNAAMYACPIMWIIAAVLVFVAVLAILISSIETNAEKMARLNESMDEVKKNAENAKKSLEEIADTRSGLNKLYTEFNNLTRGTQGWSDKLLEINSQVIDLMTKYSSLTDYITTGANGELIIEEEGWGALIEEQQQMVRSMQMTQMTIGLQQTELKKVMVADQMAKDNNMYLNQGATMGFDYVATTALTSLTGMLSPAIMGMITAKTIDTQGFMTDDAYSKILQTAGELGITVVDEGGMSDEDKDAIAESLSSQGLEFDQRQLDWTLNKMGEMGVSFEQLKNETMALSKAQEAQRDAILKQLATNLGYDTTGKNLIDTTVIGLLDKQMDDFETDVAEQLGNVQGGNIKKQTSAATKKRQQYAEATGLSIEEVNRMSANGELTNDVAEEVIAQYLVTQEYKKQMNVIRSKFSGKDIGGTEHEAFLRLATTSGSLTTDQIKLLQDTLGSNVSSAEAWKEAFEEQIGINLQELNVEPEDLLKSYNDALRAQEHAYDALTSYGMEDAKTNLSKLMTENAFTVTQAQGFSTTIADVTSRGGNSEELMNNLSDIISRIKTVDNNLADSEKIFSQAASALSNTDFSSYSSIERLVDTLKNLGVDISDLEESVKLNTNAVNENTWGHIKDNISGLTELKNNLLEREPTNMIFDEETKQKIVDLSGGKISDSDFVWDGKEFIYMGDSLQDIIDILENKISTDIEDLKTQNDKNIDDANRWIDIVQSNEFTDDAPPEETQAWNRAFNIMTGSNGEQQLGSWQEVQSVMSGYDMGSLGARVLTLARQYSGDDQLNNMELAWDIVSNAQRNASNLSVLENQKAEYETSARDYEYMNASGTKLMLDLQKGIIDQEYYNRILEAREKTIASLDMRTKKLAQTNKHLEHSNEFWGAHALDIENTNKAMDILLQSLSDNLEIIKTTNNETEKFAALENIAASATQALGIQVDASFVDQHKGLFEELWSEDVNIADAAAKKIGKLLIEQELKAKKFSQDNIDSVMEYVNQIGNIEIGATVDVTDAMNSIMALTGFSEQQAQKIMQAMNISVTSGDLDIDATRALIKEKYKGRISSYDYVSDAAVRTFAQNRGIGVYRWTATNNAPTGTGAVDRDTEGGSDDTWEEDYDWLYNLVQKMNKLLREREKLEWNYDQLIRNRTTTEADYLANLNKQRDNLEQQLELAKEKEKLRQDELSALQSEFADVAAYVWWDNATGVQINEEKMRNDEASISAEFGERIDEAVSEFERMWDEQEESINEIQDATDGIEELIEQGMERYLELEDQVFEAIVNERQEQIDKLTEINDSINDANTNILDGIRTELDRYRQQRENDEDLQEIQDAEQRLALMQSDTSGANAIDILEAQDELREKRQEYVDNQIDQALDRLSEDNEKAFEQRQEQIELMNEQLAADKKNGVIAAQVNDLMTRLMTGDESVINQIKNTLFKDQEVMGMATAKKEEWQQTLTQSIAEAISGWTKDNSLTNLVKEGVLGVGNSITFIDDTGQTRTGTVQSDGSVLSEGYYYDGIFRGANGQYVQKVGGGWRKQNTDPIPETTDTQVSEPQAEEPSVPGLGDTVHVTGVGRGNSFGGGNYTGMLNNKQARVTAYNPGAPLPYGINFMDNSNGVSAWFAASAVTFKTGGLADFTGPAWLDGTKSHPEYVLNAEQTKGFLNLVNVLDNFDGDAKQRGGDNYYDVHIEVDEIGDDYDVEQLMEKMKDLIAEDATYRNVNAVDLGRR